MMAVETDAAVAVTEADVSWLKADVAVLSNGDAMRNGAYGLLAEAGQMTALCSAIGDDVIFMAHTADTAYLYTRETWITTTRQSFLFVVVMLMLLRCQLLVDMFLCWWRWWTLVFMLCCPNDMAVNQ